jgi:hypothetical protein
VYYDIHTTQSYISKSACPDDIVSWLNTQLLATAYEALSSSAITRDPSSALHSGSQGVMEMNANTYYYVS